MCKGFIVVFRWIFTLALLLADATAAMLAGWKIPSSDLLL